MLAGPTKIDLLFPDEPHELEPPWEPTRENLAGIDDHFWDWMLWLRSKFASGKTELIASELDKMFAHLLEPLGVPRRPSSISDAIVAYRDARDHSQIEQRNPIVFG